MSGTLTVSLGGATTTGLGGGGGGGGGEQATSALTHARSSTRRRLSRIGYRLSAAFFLRSSNALPFASRALSAIERSLSMWRSSAFQVSGVGSV